MKKNIYKTKNYKVVYPFIDAQFGENPPDIDCTDMIQKALDEVGSVGGGVVMLSLGGYLLSGTLHIPKGVILAGEERDCCILERREKNGAKEKLIVCKEGASVCNMRLQVRGTSGDVINGKESFTVENVDIVASPYFKGEYYVSGEGLGNNVMIKVCGDNATVRNVRMFGIGYGVVLENGKGAKIDNVSVYTSRNGLYASKYSDIDVNLLTFRGKSEKDVEKDMFSTRQTSDCVIRLCDCDNVKIRKTDIHDVGTESPAVYAENVRGLDISDLFCENVTDTVAANNSTDVKTRDIRHVMMQRKVRG
ncbi:MAG: hypothetical protein SOZ62_01710 [Eubacteriales bacterium]|nr:hypothetical protein [Eubacteriales bacterium]